MDKNKKKELLQDFTNSGLGDLGEALKGIVGDDDKLRLRITLTTNNSEKISLGLCYCRDSNGDADVHLLANFLQQTAILPLTG